MTVSFGPRRAIYVEVDAARERLDRRARAPRAGAPHVEKLSMRLRRAPSARIPDELRLEPGSSTTLRGELGRALRYLNKASGGALVVASADLAGSTSVSAVAADFPAGFWNAGPILRRGCSPSAASARTPSPASSPASPLFGHALGVASSYGAFMAPLGHIAGAPARHRRPGAQGRLGRARTSRSPRLRPRRPEDRRRRPHARRPPGPAAPAGELPPRHRDLADAVGAPGGLAAARGRPDPSVRRSSRRSSRGPSETVLDREALGLAPAEAAVTGVYLLRPPAAPPTSPSCCRRAPSPTRFVEEALPLLLAEGIDARVYYVASAELFDLLPSDEQARPLPRTCTRARPSASPASRCPRCIRWVTSACRPAPPPCTPTAHGPLPGQRPR